MVPGDGDKTITSFRKTGPKDSGGLAAAASLKGPEHGEQRAKISGGRDGRDLLSSSVTLWHLSQQGPALA